MLQIGNWLIGYKNVTDWMKIFWMIYLMKECYWLDENMHVIVWLLRGYYCYGVNIGKIGCDIILNCYLYNNEVINSKLVC